jgi:hypothetical protein
MARPLFKGNINLANIDKEEFYVSKAGKKSLNFVIWENRDGPDQFGNTHTMQQDISKESRDAGKKGKIIGNLKIDEGESPKPKQAAPVKKPSPSGDWDDNDDNSIPF